MMLEPVTRAAVAQIVADAKLLGYELIVFETFRSEERQQQLFAQKATYLQNVGVHNYGLACDLVKLIGGQPSWKGDFSFLGALARKHNLIWGGDWGAPGQPHSFIDAVHVQRCAISQQKNLFSGTWYPDIFYNPCNKLEI